MAPEETPTSAEPVRTSSNTEVGSASRTSIVGRSLPWAATNGAMTSATVVSGATSVRATVRASPSSDIVATARSARATRSRAMGRKASPAGASRKARCERSNRVTPSSGLEAPQLPRERWLCHGHGHRGPRHRAVVHDGQEVAQEPKFQTMPHRYRCQPFEVLDGMATHRNTGPDPVPGVEVRHAGRRRRGMERLRRRVVGAHAGGPRPGSRARSHCSRLRSAGHRRRRRSSERAEGRHHRQHHHLGPGRSRSPPRRSTWPTCTSRCCGSTPPGVGRAVHARPGHRAGRPARTA